MRTKVVSFFIFLRAFKQKKIEALRPKMTKIASKGGGGPALTLSQPGGGGAHCAPPPQVHFLKYLRNALSYGLETF